MVKYFYLIEFLEQIREHIMMSRIVPTSGSYFRFPLPVPTPGVAITSINREAPLKENRYNFDNGNLGFE